MRYLFLPLILISINLFPFSTKNVELKLKVAELLESKIEGKFEINHILLPKIAKGEVIKGVEFPKYSRFIGATSFNIITNKKMYPGSCKIERYRTVYIPSEKIVRGEPIDLSKIDKKEVKVRSIVTLKYVENRDWLKGKVSKMDLQIGKPLYKSHFKSPDIVKSGDFVSIVVERKRLKITTSGVAKQSGKKGEYIMVQNVFNKKYIRAKIINSKKVTIFTGE